MNDSIIKTNTEDKTYVNMVYKNKFLDKYFGIPQGSGGRSSFRVRIVNTPKSQRRFHLKLRIVDDATSHLIPETGLPGKERGYSFSRLIFLARY